MPIHSKEHNLDKFDNYVMNDIPIRLIRLSDMKLVGRNEVRNTFRDSVDANIYFYPSELVKYAILSHRWLDEGEPTYEEMTAGTAAGPGREKLEGFCRKAKEYNVEFAWSDTCCIDKSSSTELDESIRSMFRWYENSHICIVHLAQSKTIEDIPNDEWTKRGWTLQELLAPHKIKFFNKYWMPMTVDLNDKAPRTEPDGSFSILRALETATGIPRDVLASDHGCIHWKRVDERMAWAAGRKTTRVEDAAYSLMGIFHVSLQIAYGEGRDRAFCRLIEAIMQAGDPSVLNWRGEMPALHNGGSRAFPRSPSSFLGCEDQKFDFHQPLEMTKTSLGLRIPLVILPLHLTSSSTDRLVLQCSFYPDLSITVSGDFSCHLGGCQYAFGIVNYSIIGDGTCEVLGIRGRSAGMVLFREPTDSHGYQTLSSTDISGLHFTSPPKLTLSGLKLLDSDRRLAVVDFPNRRSRSYFCIHREYLQTIYI
ncbi:hypothetical protein P692DRAFT_20779992 [Suillus brevipes Sb2]|nr:hypothetical protein P692DRAFT_20779992 [Suillus brevipes Sb2]